MAMLLNGFCTPRWSCCSVAVLGRASPAFGDMSPKLQKKEEKKTQNVPSLREDGTLHQHPVHSPTATRGHASSPQRCVLLAHATVLVSARLRTFVLEK